MKSPIDQRINDFRAYLAGNRITIKDACDVAGLNYNSVLSNLRIGKVSDERMTALEEAAVEIADSKKLSKVS